MGNIYIYTFEEHIRISYNRIVRAQTYTYGIVQLEQLNREYTFNGNIDIAIVRLLLASRRGQEETNERTSGE